MMTNKCKLSAGFFFLLYLFANNLYADANNNQCDKLDKLDGKTLEMLKKTNKSIQDLKEICGLVLALNSKEPDKINKTLQPIFERHNGLAFLRDVNFKIRTFDTVDGAPGGLGFSYDYTKTGNILESQSKKALDADYGMTWDFSTKGNVAFDSKTNPNDFLDTRIALTGYRNQGGVNQYNFGEAFFKKLNKYDDQISKIENPKELEKAIQKKDGLIHKVRAMMNSTQIYSDVNLNFGLESNQSFSEKQTTFGAQLGLDIKNYNRQSNAAKYNIFDYPFALIRMLTGYFPGNAFIPLGSTIPTIVLGVDKVDPKNNTQREALGETSSYNRLRGEIYYRTPLARIKSDNLYFNVDYRYLKETDAPDIIKSAELDKFKYTVVSITAEKGAYISFTKGRLPFDLQEQKVYELGWKFHL